MTILTMKGSGKVSPSFHVFLLISNCVADIIYKVLCNRVAVFTSVPVPFYVIFKVIKTLQSSVVGHLKLNQGHTKG
jgi:hypothetical protein